MLWSKYIIIFKLLFLSYLSLSYSSLSNVRLGYSSFDFIFWLEFCFFVGKYAALYVLLKPRKTIYRLSTQVLRKFEF